MGEPKPFGAGHINETRYGPGAPCLIIKGGQGRPRISQAGLPDSHHVHRATCGYPSAMTDIVLKGETYGYR